jgi:hypothetical protein
MAVKKTPTPTHDSTGLQRPRPLAPRNAKSGQPIRREGFGGEKPGWLDGSKAKWTTAPIEATFGISPTPGYWISA